LVLEPEADTCLEEVEWDSCSSVATLYEHVMNVGVLQKPGICIVV